MKEERLIFETPDVKLGLIEFDLSDYWSGDELDFQSRAWIMNFLGTQTIIFLN